MPWFRLDCGWWLSEWIIPLSSESQLCWIRLIEYAKEKGSRGAVKAISPSVAARIWMVGDESVRKMLEAAQTGGALEIADGDWRITNWDQFQSDPGAADRQAQSRAKRAQREPGVTVSHSESRGVTVTNGDNRESRLQDSTRQDNTRQYSTKGCPGLDEVLGFAEESGIDLDEARRFFRHYESKEWMTTTGPLGNWRGMLKSWAKPELKVEHGGRAPGSLTVEEAERLREGGPPPGSESPFARLKRELAEKAGAGDPA